MKDFQFGKDNPETEANPFAAWDTAHSKQPEPQKQEEKPAPDQGGASAKESDGRAPLDFSGTSRIWPEETGADQTGADATQEQSDAPQSDEPQPDGKAADAADATQTASGAPDGFDDFVIGKGFDLSGHAEEEAGQEEPASAPGGAKPKKKKKRRHRWVSVVIWVSVVLIISVGFAGGLILTMSDLLGLGKDSICQVTITPGMSTEEIANELKEQGAIRYPLLFRIYSRLKNYDGTYQYGIYEFNSNKGYDGIVEELQTANQAATVTVRIPERASVDDIIQLLVDNKVCTRQQFLDAMEDDYHYDFVKDIPVEKVRYRFEGYLYPDTYSFFQGETELNAKRAIERMLNNLNSKLPKDYEKRCQELGYSFHEVMTMASIVELEATGYPDEMSKVAAVFYNRLTWDEPKYLGSTPTYDYPDNRYNTNAPDGNDETEDGYEGLPPGPLCSPSIDAITAAMEPEKNFKATYFITDSDFNFYYFNNYQEHLNKIAELKRQGKWLG